MRPQPIGIFSGAAASLLLPQTAEPLQESALADLLAGDHTQAIPSDWQFFLEAIRGDIEAASRLLMQLAERSFACEETVAICAYNLFVLKPSSEQLIRLRASLPGNLIMLLELAAFNVGLASKLPDDFGLDGELLAWATACSAAGDLEREHFSCARAKLSNAAEAARGSSPLLEAILIAQSAQVASHCPDIPYSSIQRDYELAITIASQSRLPGFVAELWTQLGMMLQQNAGANRECALTAIRAYQSALQTGIQGDTRPELYADLHNNLGLAYLALPRTESSNQLRTGIAIQSFRAALAVLDSESHSEQWPGLA